MKSQFEDYLRPIFFLSWPFMNRESNICVPIMYLSCDGYFYFSLEINKIEQSQGESALFGCLLQIFLYRLLLTASQNISLG